MTDHPTLFDAVDQQLHDLDLLQPWQRPAHTLHRTEDPETSRAAARALGGRAGTMRRRLLSVYAHADWTAEEAGIEAGYTAEDGAWKRVSDLVNAGLVEDTGITRTGSHGREQRVLRITALGRGVL